MSSIYKKSVFIISWLGYSKSITTAAKMFNDSSCTDVHALRQLLHHDYFTRLWIVQEVLLAREVRFLCSKMWIKLADMQACVAERECHVRPISNESLYLLWDSFYNRDNRLLEQCIDRYSSNGCKEPRDKVYALRGVLSRKETRLLTVNYRNPIQEVYIDAVKVMASSYWSNCTSYQIIQEKRPVPAYVRISLQLAREMLSFGELGLQSFFDKVCSYEPDEEWYARLREFLLARDNIRKVDGHEQDWEQQDVLEDGRVSEDAENKEFFKMPKRLAKKAKL
jgi:hypothetical protein